MWLKVKMIENYMEYKKKIALGKTLLHFTNQKI